MEMQATGGSFLLLSLFFLSAMLPFDPPNVDDCVAAFYSRMFIRGLAWLAWPRISSWGVMLAWLVDERWKDDRRWICVVLDEKKKGQ